MEVLRNGMHSFQSLLFSNKEADSDDEISSDDEALPAKSTQPTSSSRWESGSTFQKVHPNKNKIHSIDRFRNPKTNASSFHYKERLDSLSERAKQLPVPVFFGAGFIASGVFGAIYIPLSLVKLGAAKTAGEGVFWTISLLGSTAICFVGVAIATGGGIAFFAYQNKETIRDLGYQAGIKTCVREGFGSLAKWFAKGLPSLTR